MVKKKNPKKKATRHFKFDLERIAKHIGKIIDNSKVTDIQEIAAVASGSFLFYGATKAFEETPMLQDYGPFGFLTMPLKPEDIPFSIFGVLGTLAKSLATKDEGTMAGKEIKPLDEATKIALSFFASYFVVKHGVPFSRSLFGVPA